jgi:hypothetical protein
MSTINSFDGLINNIEQLPPKVPSCTLLPFPLPLTLAFGGPVLVI